MSFTSVNGAGLDMNLGASLVNIEPTSLLMGYHNFVASSLYKTIEIDSTTMTITDGSELKGFVYAADYSTAGEADDRWIPDYAAVKAYADSVGGGGGVSVTNQADNRVVTATGVADTLNGEANLTFNGTILAVTGGLSVSTATVNLTGLGSDDTEDHVIAIDDTTGLLSKRSVASLTNGAVFWGTPGNDYEIPVGDFNGTLTTAQTINEDAWFVYDPTSDAFEVSNYNGAGHSDIHGVRIEPKNSGQYIQITRSYDAVEYLDFWGGLSWATFKPGEIRIRGGDAGTATYPNGGDVKIIGGIPYTVGDNDGGDIYIYGGPPDNGGARGEVFLGDGTSIGTLKENAVETDLVAYDTVTGLLSYRSVASLGSSIPYPTGSGIPIVVSGTSWGTTINDNSTQWDAGYTHSQIAGGDSVHVSVTENTNWDSAYSHISLTNNPHSVDATDILPSQGTHSGKFLTTNGTVLSWAVGGGSVAGSDTHVQFNNSGAFGGSANFTWDDSTLAVTGAITATGEITAYVSDKRLKKNIKNIENPIEKIMKINGVTHEWEDFVQELGFNPARKVETSTIAQEIGAVIPDGIAPAPFDVGLDGKSISGKDYITVRNEKIVPLLIEAIKAQQVMIEELQNK